MNNSIIISGAGIGGLTLALALQRRGIFARVFERTRALSPAGAGLAIQPNAMRVLLALELGDEVMAAGHAVERAAMLDERGRLLGREQDMAALSAPFGAPVVAIHRARLHEILMAALAPATVELGTEVVDYEMRGGHAIVRLADGATEHPDVLVGADGLRSKIRARMIDDGEPRYSGYTSWRGVTTAGSVRLERMSESWGRGERFGMVDIGHGEVYWFAVANAPAGGSDGPGTDGEATRGELIRRFGHWHAPVRAVIEATPAAQVLRTDIADRDPIGRWHDGHVVLLGDAAHPMTPNLGQGACQAIEDASVLAEALSTSDSIESAFARYEATRVARANSIVVAARRFGAVAQWSSPLATRLRAAAMRLAPESAVRRQLSALWTPAA